MPKLFSRRYMRGKPKSAEKRIGALVLALAGLIVAIFVLTGGLFDGVINQYPALVRARSVFGISDAPLFTVRPENLPQPAPPREVRLAEALLPASLSADGPDGQAVRAYSLRTDADVAAVQDAGVEAAFIEAVRDLNARWIYTRQYGENETTGVRVQVADIGDPAAAMDACKARTPEDGRPLAVGRGGWRMGRRAGFWSGRYYTEVLVSEDQGPALEEMARAMGSVQLAYGGPFIEPAPSVATAGPEEVEAPVALGAGVARFAEVPGSTLDAPARIERYAENLYEKINGKESAFRAFFVVDLKFGQYMDREARQTYDVYIYDMAQPVNAMGMYMSERVPSAESAEMGRDGYVSGTSVFFWKGQYYVNVLGPPDGGEAELNQSRRIASAIAETIADDEEPFWADQVLPVENRVPHTFSYQAISALGYEFLQRMFFCTYEVSGKQLQMYLTRATDPDAAHTVYARFVESTARYDKELAREELPDGELFVFETPMPGRSSKFGAAFHKGSYFGGVYDGQDHDISVAQAKALFESLSADDAGDPDAVPVVAEPSVDADEDDTYGESDSYEESGSSSVRL